jgi:AcrR family transcriptional regulator
MTGSVKGIQTRTWLIDKSREVFNEQGFGITLAFLAKSLNITLGMLTYHFTTKDHLFIAIADEYQIKYQELITSENKGVINLNFLHSLMIKILDLQYEYRCAIRYVSTSTQKQLELSDHITESYRNNKTDITLLLQSLVSNGELSETIFEPSDFDVFLFSFTCLFTTWPFILEIYHANKSYDDLKPVFLKGIFATFLPHLTPNGEQSLRQLGVIK